jgi:DNA-binding MarR family transcriptional regulator
VSCEDGIELDEYVAEPDLGFSVDDEVTIDLRLGLSQVAEAEASRLRESPARRPTRSQLARLAYEIHLARMRRDRLFNEELFGEPAWDILLCLYALPARGEMLTVTSLSLAANVAPTTGIRWQQTLELEGLIKRGPHILDQRLRLVGLTQRGRLLMDEYLTHLFHSRGAPYNGESKEGPHCIRP